MSTREARLADAPVIARIHAAAREAAYRAILADELANEPSVAQRTADWERRLQPGAPARRHFVVERDGAVVGWASVGPCRDADKPPGTRELYAIYLDPSHWRSGVGTELYARAEVAAARYGTPEICLWVLEPNERARAFYARLGFAADGTRRPDPSGVAALRYAKALR
jgi:L-amino acid N-acyltransferase YncA